MKSRPLWLGDRVAWSTRLGTEASTIEEMPQLAGRADVAGSFRGVPGSGLSLTDHSDARRRRGSCQCDVSSAGCCSLVGCRRLSVSPPGGNFPGPWAVHRLANMVTGLALLVGVMLLNRRIHDVEGVGSLACLARADFRAAPRPSSLGLL